MKIFNWVHRRFLHNVHSSTISLHEDGFARNVKKVEPAANDGETKVLLEHGGGFANVLEGWRDGILTIGTLGFDPLKPFNHQTERPITDKFEYYDFYDEYEEEEDEYSFNNGDDGDGGNTGVGDEGELDPLVFSAYSHEFEAEIGSNLEKDYGISLSPLVGSPDHDLGSNMLGNDQEMKKKGERITLADLFLADSEVKRKKDSAETAPDSAKKTVIRSKNGLSFAKKLIPRVKEDARPIKKLHGLMRKMLKRKIHPELEGEINNSNGEINSKDEDGGCETVSLLQTSDAVV